MTLEEIQNKVGSAAEVSVSYVTSAANGQVRQVFLAEVPVAFGKGGSGLVALAEATAQLAGLSVDGDTFRIASVPGDNGWTVKIHFSCSR